MASDESVAIHRLAGELRSLTIEVEQQRERLDDRIDDLCYQLEQLRAQLITTKRDVRSLQ
jgi:hypothetical protein